MTMRFDDQVAIVTGAGNGLGKSHALVLAKRGAKVVVNDFGGSRDGSGGSASPAEQVVDEIMSSSGEAIANDANVTSMQDCQAMVEQALDQWGRVDILINNAGILKDKSFGKMDDQQWQAVIDVHLNGSANCSRAVWNIMKEQNYGRILMTSSTSGIYGNFGQANYGAAKMGVIGLMNTLCLEGVNSGININCLAPTAATRMTEDVLNEEMLAALHPKFVTPAAIYLVSKEAPTRKIMFAGGGTYSTLEIRESKGLYFKNEDRNPETIAANIDKISDTSQADVFTQGMDHISKVLLNDKTKGEV